MQCMYDNLLTLGIAFAGSAARRVVPISEYRRRRLVEHNLLIRLYEGQNKIGGAHLHNVGFTIIPEYIQYSPMVNIYIILQFLM